MHAFLAVLRKRARLFYNGRILMTVPTDVVAMYSVRLFWVRNFGDICIFTVVKDETSANFNFKNWQLFCKIGIIFHYF
jgi:hypothetical protein